jgi:hypothetical protein
MHAPLVSPLEQKVPGLLMVIVRPLAMLLPALLLLIATLRAPAPHALMLWLGTAFQVLVCCLHFASRQGWRVSLGPSLIALYVIALGWLWLGSNTISDWYTHLAQSILLVVPLLVFSRQMLSESGASALRRGRLLADRLAARKDWPHDLSACRSLPEVKALREALHSDASPALALLTHKRPEVRIAALAALEFRQNWLRGQAELVLHVVQHAPEPTVRAAAITALANLEDRPMIEVLAEFLRDPSWEVRRAATEALLWDSERRWAWVRHAVRRCLGDPAIQEDGALRSEGQPLTVEAVGDLTAWAAEKGVLGVRAALTLGAHYSRSLSERPDPALVGELRRQLDNPQTAPALRMELAGLLQQHQLLDQEVLERLLEPSNPAPLRLLGVEALLAEGEHPEAVAALHELARLPNREIALATADVVQRRMGVDLGLPPRQPLPPVQSRQAAEVTRRVMMWASQHDQPALHE